MTDLAETPNTLFNGSLCHLQTPWCWYVSSQTSATTETIHILSNGVILQTCVSTTSAFGPPDGTTKVDCSLGIDTFGSFTPTARI